MTRKVLSLGFEDLCWLLDWVGQQDPTDGPDCVVRAARRLIGELREQISEDEIGDVNDWLESFRGWDRDVHTLWTEPQDCGRTNEPAAG